MHQVLNPLPQHIAKFRCTNVLFLSGATAPNGPWPPHSRRFYITHNDAPQSVGLLWTSDQLVAENSTWQHTAFTTDIQPWLRVHCCFFFTLDAGLLARSQYSEGPATGNLDTGFSWFPCAYKQMLRRFPTFQVATTCFSCSSPDLNLVVTDFMFCLHVK